MKKIDLKPSHFVSKIHSGSENGSSTSVASIGRIAAGMRAARAPRQIVLPSFFNDLLTTMGLVTHAVGYQTGAQESSLAISFAKRDAATGTVALQSVLIPFATRIVLIS